MSALDRYIARFFKKLNVRFWGDVLDVGCGEGRLSEYVAAQAKSVTAVDIVENPRWRESTAANLAFQVGDAERLSFADASFDMIFSVNMLHHTPSPERALREMIRVRKPGGRIVIVEPNRWNPLGYVHLTLMGNHQHFPTRRFLQLVGDELPNFDHRQFECHCFPFPAGIAVVLEILEDRLDRFKPWRPLIFYNAAVG